MIGYNTCLQQSLLKLHKDFIIRQWSIKATSSERSRNEQAKSAERTAAAAQLSSFFARILRPISQQDVLLAAQIYRDVGRSENMWGQAQNNKVFQCHGVYLKFLLKYVGDCPSGPQLRRPCLKVSSSSRVLPTIDNHTTVTRCQRGRKIYIDFFSQSNFAIICDFDIDDFRNSAHVFLPTIEDHTIVSRCQKFA